MSKFRYVLLLFLISSCSNFKQNVGLVKNQPDEYQVSTNQPLSVPPNFNIYSPEELANKRANSEQVNNENLSQGENQILQDLNK